MPESPRVDPRRARTAEALVRAAREIFAERPVGEVTTDEIAARAGVAVGSIYNHFGSKAALHAATVDLALDMDRQFMDRAYLPDRTPVEQLLAAGQEYLRFYLAYPDYFRTLAFPPEPGQYQASQELAERLADRVHAQNSRLADTLRQGIETGAIRDTIDPDEVATVLWACWNGIISLAWRPDRLRLDQIELAKLVDAATDVVTGGLFPPGPA